MNGERPEIPSTDPVASNFGVLKQLEAQLRTTWSPKIAADLIRTLEERVDHLGDLLGQEEQPPVRAHLEYDRGLAELQVKHLASRLKFGEDHTEVLSAGKKIQAHIRHFQRRGV